MNKNALLNYKNTLITTANKERILLLLYEGALKFIKIAEQAMENHDIQKKCQYILKAQDIVIELNNTLNFDVNKDLAIKLEALYMFVNDQLVKANITNDTNHLTIAHDILKTLYSGWTEAIDKNKCKGKVEVSL